MESPEIATLCLLTSLYNYILLFGRKKNIMEICSILPNANQACHVILLPCWLRPLQDITSKVYLFYLCAVYRF